MIRVLAAGLVPGEMIRVWLWGLVGEGRGGMMIWAWAVFPRWVLRVVGKSRARGESTVAIAVLAWGRSQVREGLRLGGCRWVCCGKGGWV